MATLKFSMTLQSHQNSHVGNVNCFYLKVKLVNTIIFKIFESFFKKIIILTDEPYNVSHVHQTLLYIIPIKVGTKSMEFVPQYPMGERWV